MQNPKSTNNESVANLRINESPIRYSIIRLFVKNSLFADRRGITLLLVILVLAALLSISIGIYDVIFAELRLSGEIADSFVALYAADEAIERGLFEDRDATPYCIPIPGRVANCYDSGWITIASGACYRLRVSKIAISPTVTDVSLRATGEFPCGGGTFAVKRALSTDYRVEE